MKKIFTLVALASMAIGVNAQETTLPADWYPIKSITWKDIRWYNDARNNKKDQENKDMLFLMGTGNGYENLYCKAFWNEDNGTDVYQPEYTYIDYEAGETGLPKYGLYYQFTAKANGKLKVCVWVNKGGDNRKTFIVKVSDKKPLTPFVDYTFEGYVNGQNKPTDIAVIDEETGEQKLDNDNNPVFVMVPIFFNTEEFKVRHDEKYVVDGVDTKPYRLDEGNQAVWGWINLDVVAGESYVLYQQSSQIGFGGYDFTPAGGSTESYVACLDMGGDIVLDPAFAAVVEDVIDPDTQEVKVKGKATNVTDEGSVVNFGTANMEVKAVGGAEPNTVEPEGYTPGPPAGISAIKNINTANVPVFNLAGQKVSKDFKGMVIMNGKKFMNK